MLVYIQLLKQIIKCVFVFFFRLNFSSKAGGTAVSVDSPDVYEYSWFEWNLLQLTNGACPVFYWIINWDFSRSLSGFCEINKHKSHWLLPLSSELTGTKALNKNLTVLPKCLNPLSKYQMETITLYGRDTVWTAVSNAPCLCLFCGLFFV